MPGIVGFTNYFSEQEKSIRALKEMRDLITHQDFYVRDALFCDGRVCASRSFINVIQKEPQPYSEAGMYVWLDGEFFNRPELEQATGKPAGCDAARLLHLFGEGESFASLEKIDGFYSAVIYDANKGMVYLVTDRYGFRYLFWTVHENALVWASELKALLAVPGFRPVIKPEAVSEFISIGYLLEDNTWFEGVELLSPGTVLAWDLASRSYTRHRYWWWDRIKPAGDTADENHIVERLGELFVKAVERRCCGEERICISLSGGLDSRSLLAAARHNGRQVTAFTFGKKGCDDIRIAAMAARAGGVPHEVFELNAGNWLAPRVPGIWWTDGMLDLMHMHGIEINRELKHSFDVNLNGFAGDLLLGGSYLRKGRLDKPVDSAGIAEKLGCAEDFPLDLDQYRSLGKTDFFHIQNRVRRFTYGGLKIDQVFIEHRAPDLDNDLIDYVYSLPDKYRYHSHIYNKMLLKYFPEYFTHIPWQKTGYPISLPYALVRLMNMGKSGLKLAKKTLFRSSDENRNYSDYAGWIRAEPAKSFFTGVLSSPQALYPGYIPRERVLRELENHFLGEDCSINLCRYLTFEIWLQQVYNRRYRDNEVPLLAAKTIVNAS
jgi:asparagine synthase (glutamine-hydrolysing)